MIFFLTWSPYQTFTVQMNLWNLTFIFNNNWVHYEILCFCMIFSRNWCNEIIVVMFLRSKLIFLIIRNKAINLLIVFPLIASSCNFSFVFLILRSKLFYSRLFTELLITEFPSGLMDWAFYILEIFFYCCRDDFCLLWWVGPRMPVFLRSLTHLSPLVALFKKGVRAVQLVGRTSRYLTFCLLCHAWSTTIACHIIDCVT